MERGLGENLFYKKGFHQNCKLCDSKASHQKSKFCNAKRAPTLKLIPGAVCSSRLGAAQLFYEDYEF